MQERIADIPTRFVFESALELMSYTNVGSFTMAAKPGKKQGMPPAVILTPHTLTSQTLTPVTWSRTTPEARSPTPGTGYPTTYSPPPAP